MNQKNYLEIANKVLAKALLGRNAKENALKVMVNEYKCDEAAAKEAIDIAYAEYARAYDK